MSQQQNVIEVLPIQFVTDEEMATSVPSVSLVEEVEMVHEDKGEMDVETSSTHLSQEDEICPEGNKFIRHAIFLVLDSRDEKYTKGTYFVLQAQYLKFFL